MRFDERFLSIISATWREYSFGILTWKWTWSPPKPMVPNSKQQVSSSRKAAVHVSMCDCFKKPTFTGFTEPRQLVPTRKNESINVWPAPGARCAGGQPPSGWRIGRGRNEVEAASVEPPRGGPQQMTRQKHKGRFLGGSSLRSDRAESSAVS